MKKVVNVGIGGKSFTIDEDAYELLSDYLSSFRSRIKGIQTKEIMDDIEERIAELFSERINTYKDVVSIELVNNVVNQLGMPDGEPYEFNNGKNENTYNYNCNNMYQKPPKKLYRNPLDKMIGGVCSGIAAYFNLEVPLIRIIFFVGLILGSVSFWVYIVIWIVAPLANTPAQKCEMFGLPATAENLSKFTYRR